MTKQECKKLAKQIAKYEIVIQKSESKEAVQAAKEQLNNLIMSSDFSFADMAYIDDLVKKILAWF